MKIVKRVITIMLVGIMVLFVGCAKADFDDTNVAEARKAVSEYYKWSFVIVPEGVTQGTVLCASRKKIVKAMLKG